jgi:hypothetical protein
VCIDTLQLKGIITITCNLITFRELWCLAAEQTVLKGELSEQLYKYCNAHRGSPFPSSSVNVETLATLKAMFVSIEEYIVMAMMEKNLGDATASVEGRLMLIRL